ncbi:MAG: SAM-dependent chlorinase/fluorinase [Anaerolineae bacterium]
MFSLPHLAIISGMIAIMTDFGLNDTYVGVMKGVIAGICPDTPCVDLTHNIPRQQVQQGAFALRNAYAYFPAGTVFLAVVDPGVGSTRRPIAVHAGGYTFVAPDNGLLTYVLAQHEGYQAVILENPAYRLGTVSNTFHGRDIFAPAAAHLACGVPLAEMGRAITDLVQLPRPLLDVHEDQITGEVIDIDTFGNVTTSIGQWVWASERLGFKAVFGPALTREFEAQAIRATFGAHTLAGVQPNYSVVQAGAPLLLIGSSGFLEIGVNQGSAAEMFGLKIGDRVSIGADNAAVRD